MMENKKKGSVLGLLLAIGLIGLFIYAVYYFTNKFFLEKQNEVVIPFSLNTGETWKDKYGYYLHNNVYKDVSVSFIDLTLNEVPEMILTYVNNNENFLQIVYLDNNEDVKFSKEYKSVSLDVLYRVSNKTYFWCLKSVNDKEAKYSSISNVLSGESFMSISDLSSDFDSKYVTADLNVSYTKVSRGFRDSDYLSIVNMYDKELYINEKLESKIEEKIRKIKEPVLVCSLLNDNVYKAYTIYFDENKEIVSATLKMNFTLTSEKSIDEFKNEIITEYRYLLLNSANYKVSDDGRSTVSLIINYTEAIEDLTNDAIGDNDLEILKNTLRKIGMSCFLN